jgi:hypothetical protein
VEALGVGASVRKLTVENLADALITATTDQRQIARAKLVGEQIRSVRPFFSMKNGDPGTEYRRAGKWRGYGY